MQWFPRQREIDIVLQREMMMSRSKKEINYTKLQGTCGVHLSAGGRMMSLSTLNRCVVIFGELPRATHHDEDVLEGRNLGRYHGGEDVMGGEEPRELLQRWRRATVELWWWKEIAG